MRQAGGMRYVEVGGVRVSVIGLGTWQFGSREWGYGDEYANHEAGAIVERALDLGINLIDTAEIYGFGKSERIVGEAIADRRDEAFIATKILPVAPLASVVEQRARGSARRLGVEQIDLYQLHWPNPLAPTGWAMDGMRRVCDRGLVRHVGVSNYSLARWKAAERSLARPVLSNQVQFSLVSRGPQRDLIPYAQSEGRIVIAYSPLAQGFLSARYDPSVVDAIAPKAGGVRLANPLFTPENLDAAVPLFTALREVARGHDATPAQVALAWVISHPNVVAIPGASSVAQLERNVDAANIELTGDDLGRLGEAAEAFHPRRAIASVPNLVRGLIRR